MRTVARLVTVIGCSTLLRLATAALSKSWEDQSTAGPRFSSSGVSHGWRASALTEDGILNGIPGASQRIVRMDPAVGEVASVGPASAGVDELEGGVVAASGHMYGTPQPSGMILKIETLASDATTFGSLGTHDRKWASGVLARNATLLGIPHSASPASRSDPSFNVDSGGGALDPGPRRWAGGVLVRNGSSSNDCRIGSGTRFPEWFQGLPPCCIVPSLMPSEADPVEREANVRVLSVAMRGRIDPDEEGSIMTISVLGQSVAAWMHATPTRSRGKLLTRPACVEPVGVVVAAAEAVADWDGAGAGYSAPRELLGNGAADADGGMENASDNASADPGHVTGEEEQEGEEIHSFSPGPLVGSSAWQGRCNSSTYTSLEEAKAACIADPSESCVFLHAVNCTYWRLCWADVEEMEVDDSTDLDACTMTLDPSEVNEISTNETGSWLTTSIESTTIETSAETTTTLELEGSGGANHSTTQMSIGGDDAISSTSDAVEEQGSTNSSADDTSTLFVNMTSTTTAWTSTGFTETTFTSTTTETSTRSMGTTATTSLTETASSTATALVATPATTQAPTVAPTPVPSVRVSGGFELYLSEALEAADFIEDPKVKDALQSTIAAQAGTPSAAVEVTLELGTGNDGRRLSDLVVLGTFEISVPASQETQVKNMLSQSSPSFLRVGLEEAGIDGVTVLKFYIGEHSIDDPDPPLVPRPISPETPAATDDGSGASNMIFIAVGVSGGALCLGCACIVFCYKMKIEAPQGQVGLPCSESCEDVVPYEAKIERPRQTPQPQLPVDPYAAQDSEAPMAVRQPLFRNEGRHANWDTTSSEPLGSTADALAEEAELVIDV